MVYRVKPSNHVAPFYYETAKQTNQQKVSLQRKGNGKRGCFWRGNREGCGEGAVGVPGLVLLSASAACETGEPCLLLTAGDTTAAAHWSSQRWANSKLQGKTHWKQWLVWNYLTCFPCFKELLLRQQQLAEDERCRVWGWQSWACGGGVSLPTPSCGPCPQLLQIPLLPQT